MYTSGTTPELTWTTADADTNLLEITPGAYEHRDWFFTRPGTYVLQVHAKGHPSSAFQSSEGIDELTVASEVVRYTFHVGKLADVGVGITASNTSPDPGDTVTFTVTASNAGPDAATDTVVEVILPEGLSNLSATPPASGTFAPYDINGDLAGLGGDWSVGTLAAPQAPTAQTSRPTTTATLTFTAQVSANHALRGHPLIVVAAIEAGEEIGGSEVVELDQAGGNNVARVAITPTVIPNLPPLFQIERSVPETTRRGTKVGAPVQVRELNNLNGGATDTLTFSLSGDGAGDFDVNNVDGGVQIVVDTGYNGVRPFYNLVLHVRDGKDYFGNEDSSSDSSIAVHIIVPDP